MAVNKERESSNAYLANAHPFQRLCYANCHERGVLLAAAGPRIYSYDVANGFFLSYWPSESHKLHVGDGSTDALKEECEPPEKRRKLSSPDQQSASRSTSVSVEIVVDKPPPGYRRKPKIVDPSLPNVSHLVCTSDAKHAVAITAEDKCVRVFEIDREGSLISLSERCMPKRPCAVVLSSDDSTILVGDKFGDVYSLPLHFVPAEGKPSDPSSTSSGQEAFNPSASELTVHTKGNLKALKQQRASKVARPQKSGPDFEYKLILGHVSLLTDLKYVELSVAEIKSVRSYLLTSDRDEHIRISRGPPQGHIIENYCLGHTEFISKLCILPWAPDVLLSGGGDNQIISWDWKNGILLYDIDLSSHIRGHVPVDLNGKEETADASKSPGSAPNKVAVSGIWAISSPNLASSDPPLTGVVLVALEGIPILLSLLVTSAGDITYHDTIKLRGNALDVALVDQQKTAAVSIDSVHEVGSTKVRRKSTDESPPLVEMYHLQCTGNKPTWHSLRGMHPLVATITQEGTFDIELEAELISKAQKPTLGEFLYGLENLRKTVQTEQEED